MHWAQLFNVICKWLSESCLVSESHEEHHNGIKECSQEAIALKTLAIFRLLVNFTHLFAASWYWQRETHKQC